MTTADDDRDDMEKAIAKSKSEHAARLKAAKADAARRGKEPFDLAALEALCDTSHEGRMAPTAERQAEFEAQYYVACSEMMTIAEFAQHVTLMSRW